MLILIIGKCRVVSISLEFDLLLSKIQKAQSKKSANSVCTQLFSFYEHIIDTYFFTSL